MDGPNPIVLNNVAAAYVRSADKSSMTMSHVFKYVEKKAGRTLTSPERKDLVEVVDYEIYKYNLRQEGGEPFQEEVVLSRDVVGVAEGYCERLRDPAIDKKVVSLFLHAVHELPLTRELLNKTELVDAVGVVCGKVTGDLQRFATSLHAHLVAMAELSNTG